MGWKSVRRFGLGHCDMPTMLSNVGFFLRLLSLNIDRRYKPIPLVIHITMAIMFLCSFYTYLFNGVWFVFWYSPQMDDFLPAIVVLSLVVSSEIGAAKLLFMHYFHKELQEIVDGCLACDAEVVPNSRFANNIMRILKNVKRRAMVFWLAIMTNGTVYAIAPILLRSGKHYALDDFVLYAFQPMFESPNYEINMIIQTIAIMTVCYVPATITSFFIVINGYTEAQMLGLSEELNHLWDDAVENFRDTEQGDVVPDDRALNIYIKQHLENIIRVHTNNLKLLSQIEFIFRGPLAIQFVLLTISLIVELLGGLENTWIELPFALIPVGIECMTGQKLVEASQEFETAVYNCGWEKFDVSNRKMVLLLLTNAQKPMKLSAGGMMQLNYQTFMYIVKSIFSAYTALRSTMQ